MSTNCKLIFGYVDNDGWWHETKAFYRHYDGYTDAIVPLLKQTNCDVEQMSKIDSHKWEELVNSYDGVSSPDFIYFVDKSDLSNIRVSVLKDDIEFYKRYGISNLQLVMEFSITS